jgi:predicted dehydrogenase
MTEKPRSEKGSKMKRRDLLKAFATLPVIGAFAYGAWRKRKQDHIRSHRLARELNMTSGEPAYKKYKYDGDVIRLGIIGYGSRGTYLMQAAGFVPPETINDWQVSMKYNPRDTSYEDFIQQDDLNIVVNGVCDLFDVRAENARKAAANVGREGPEGTMGKLPKRYINYRELLAAEDIDAVIIATPDHWHARIAIDAALAGKHIYVEKGLARRVEEVFAIRKAVKESGVVFQLGHQGRQTDSYIKAKEAVEKNLLGKINLIEVCTNRNDPNGAWIYDIHPEANPRTVDWKQFEEPCEKKHPFSAERFFRWRCWWDYGTGLSGDLLTHEYDAINQILGMGIPESVVSSGGIYFFEKPEYYVNEVRDVPDVWNATFEYPHLNFSLLYSATLANSRDRGKVIMGHDASMELGNNLLIYACAESTRYRDAIESGLIQPDLPIYTYIPGRKNVDAVATATEQYFANRGLLYTYRGDRRVDTTHLHIAEWIQAIRGGKQTSCNIDQAFEEGITAVMATIAYREDRKVFWDREREKVV